MHLSTGTGFFNETWFVPNAWGGAAYTWVGDFNGDGKTDIASALSDQVFMHLSTGTGFVNETWFVSNVWAGPGSTWVCDLHGDGKTDVASASRGKVYVQTA